MYSLFEIESWLSYQPPIPLKYQLLILREAATSKGNMWLWINRKKQTPKPRYNSGQ